MSGMPHPTFAPAAIEAGRHLFTRHCTFLRGVLKLEQMPDADLPEVAFAGRSNVGKSSLINRLYGDAVQETIIIREDGKGRHTTTSRELIRLPTGGLVIDTPGLREFQLWASSEALADTFNDIVEIGVDCQFTDCRHDTEPNCAVRIAVEKGKLDRKRVANFIKLRSEATAVEKLRRERREPSGRVKTPRSARHFDEDE